MDNFLWQMIYLYHATVFRLVYRWLRGKKMARCYTGPPKAPTFNLNTGLWTNFGGLWVGPPLIAPTYTFHATLTPGERYYGLIAAASFIFILCPKGTDVHFSRAGFPGGVDYFECPLGSGMYYRVRAVDDVGKGWPNEYRQVHVEHWPPYPAVLP